MQLLQMKYQEDFFHLGAKSDHVLAMFLFRLQCSINEYYLICHPFGFGHTGKHLNGLAYAATGYKRVLEENRKLYNLVQDLKGNLIEKIDLCQSYFEDLESLRWSFNLRNDLILGNV